MDSGDLDSSPAAAKPTPQARVSLNCSECFIKGFSPWKHQCLLADCWPKCLVTTMAGHSSLKDVSHVPSTVRGHLLPAEEPTGRPPDPLGSEAPPRKHPARCPRLAVWERPWERLDRHPKHLPPWTGTGACAWLHTVVPTDPGIPVSELRLRARDSPRPQLVRGRSPSDGSPG